MRHPFDLSFDELLAQDLEFEDSLPNDEAEQIGGGFWATTLALGEEGGHGPSRPHPRPKPWPFPKPICPPHPPEVTTKALGEEGGGPWPHPPEVTTLAVGEEGGDYLH
ncbi:MAG: hypothetical protein HC929_00655 [Leptolyngbyaceae cyanobacterium SM2_5_2]|nr:hypothetical protein [Leptolyngbyaceae cyanobacterium SM2_5_2]